MRRQFLLTLAALLATDTMAVGETPEIGAGAPHYVSTQVAMAELGELLAAYSAGNTALAETMVLVSMIGRQQLFDAMRASLALQKQIRISLRDPRFANTDSVIIIQTNWDKRYLTLPTLAPKLQSGSSSFVMQKTPDGWRLAGLSGDNIFNH